MRALVKIAALTALGASLAYAGAGATSPAAPAVPVPGSSAASPSGAALTAVAPLEVAAVATADTAVAAKDAKLEADARDFLALYSHLHQQAERVSEEVAWVASTDVNDIHTAARAASNRTLAAISGDPEVIRRARLFLAESAKLEPITVRQLQKVLEYAAENPGTIPEISEKRIEAESRLSAIQDGYTFCMERDTAGACSRPITVNAINDAMSEVKDLEQRRKVWEVSKEIGNDLKPGLIELRDLRNRVAREMGHRSYFDLQVSSYGMTSAEMLALLDRFIADTKPIYDALHCYTRGVLAKRYAAPVPKGAMPAHWLPNRWSQDWTGIIPGIDLDAAFAQHDGEWIVKQAERFYTSMGMPSLPASFWVKSDLYALPADARRKKNTHASAWHIDKELDVRSLMSVEPDSDWFGTAHHELGHIYYYLYYSRPEVPYLLREGANRSFHEGMGDLIALAAQQQPYLRQLGILKAGQKVDPTLLLLNDALGTVVFLPWSAGVMSHWEYDLYANELPAEKFNERWWEYVRKYQGIEPPAARPAAGCDACTKTHIIDDPAGYYDYALATVLKHQLHDHICRDILKEDPHSCLYYGRKEVGDFLASILKKGGTQDWRSVLKEATGEELSTRALVEYYAPLLKWLNKQNRGQACTAG